MIIDNIMKGIVFIISLLASLPPLGLGATTFTVTGPDRAPVGGALITVDGTQRATTAPDGSAAIDLTQGAHEFTVVKEGCFNVLQKLPADGPRAARVEVALRQYTPWSSFVINDFESNDPAKNRVKYYPAQPAIKRSDPGWFFNCVGEHEGTVLTYGADNHASFTEGDYLTCDFEGTSIRVFTLRTSNSGMARISVDGGGAQRVDLFSKKNFKGSDYELAYEKHDLAPGKHTVRLEVLGEKREEASDAKVYFDFCDTSGYPVFPRFGITPYGVTGNNAEGITLTHALKTAGPGGFESVEEVGFVAVDAAQKRAPTINDLRIKARLDAGNRFSVTSTAFEQRVKYVALSYVVVAGVIYYSEEPVFFTPAPRIVLARNVLGLMAGQGASSTREIALRDAGGIADLKWKLVSQGKYDGTPATGIISRAFADGATAVKGAPLKITGLSEGEAVIRCYSAGDPDNTYADCLVTVAKAEKPEKISRLPMMGWSTWNYYGRSISREEMYKAAANMLKPLAVAGGKSLKDLGYVYFQVDGGWRMNWLAPDGRIMPNARFGGMEGLKELSDYLHANGLKLGLHMCPGWGDCAGQPMGSDGFERIQLPEYVHWNTDLLFVDICASEQNRRNDPDSEYVKTIYTKFKYYLDNCGRDMLFLASGVKGFGYYPVVSWRVAGDISTFINTSSEGGGRWLDPLDRPKPKNAAAFTEARSAGNQWRIVGPEAGLWAHADAMSLGDPGLNLTEQQSMFNMWCITAANLTLGGDLNKITDGKEGIVQIITNEEAIAVNQDPLGKAGHILKSYTNNPAYGKRNPDPATASDRPEVNLTVYGRPLFDGSWALVLMNNTEKKQTLTVKFADLDYDGSIGGNTKLGNGLYYLRNLNTREDMGMCEDQFTCNDLPVHGSVMIKVTPERYHQDCDCH